MSATGLDVFDKTLQSTNIWLDEIMEKLGPDRQVAWHVLSAVLHALRDRLQIGLAVHLGAQLPLLVRGLYYDQWHPGGGDSFDKGQHELHGLSGGDVCDRQLQRCGTKRIWRGVHFGAWRDG